MYCVQRNNGNIREISEKKSWIQEKKKENIRESIEKLLGKKEEKVEQKNRK